MPYHHVDALMEGTEIADWDGSLVIRCDDPGPTEDFPWAKEHIVSDRLRRLLEAHAPGCAQYLPVTIAHHDGTHVLEPYWIANWLRTIDFYDRTHTDMMSTQDGTSFFEVVVDASKIPNDAPICRMKDFSNFIVIRDDIKKAIKNSGMTGCQFYSVKMLHDILQDPKTSPTYKRRLGQS